MDAAGRKFPMPDPVLVTAISHLLAPLPSITEEKTPTHATYFIGRKIFAFTRSGGGGGVALKLPAERIAELLQREHITILKMGKRTMKEWILLDHPKPTDYMEDLDLFKESIAFVASTKHTPRKSR
jgi:hypothetical protein